MALTQILILATNSKSTDRLKLDEKVRGTQAALGGARNWNEFEVNIHWAARVKNRQKVLPDQKPQIVHLSKRRDGAKGSIGKVYEFGCNATDPQKHSDVSTPLIKRKLEVVDSVSKPIGSATYRPTVLKNCWLL